MFFQVASATATRYGLSRGLLGLKYDQIHYSDSDSERSGMDLYTFYFRSHPFRHVQPIGHDMA